MDGYSTDDIYIYKVMAHFCQHPADSRDIQECVTYAVR